MTQHRIAVDGMSPGSAKRIVVPVSGEDRPLAIICDTEGVWYAIDDTCTHANVSLSEGEVGDGTVECWAHCAKFNLQTGEGELPAPAPVNTYPVKVEGGDVLVEVE